MAVSAAPTPLTDSGQIARFFLDVYRRQPGLTVHETPVNGTPGLIAKDAAGHVLANHDYVRVALHFLTQSFVNRFQHVDRSGHFYFDSF